MRITVIGLGYVGLANLAVLSSDKSLETIGFDKDFFKVAALHDGTYPFDEESLRAELSLNKPLITSDPLQALKGSSAYLIAVGTPSLQDGTTDLSSLFDSLSLIRSYADKDAFIVIRSTVPVGTASNISAFLNKGSKHSFKVISLPEFLSEGTALADERKPARIVVGAIDKASFEFVRTLKEREIKSGVPLLEMSNESAELAKYASNAFLAMKISFINELARYSEKSGADIAAVALAVGADPRIGSAMLKPGIGYGGSCFSKDMASLINQSAAINAPLLLPEAAAAINQTQPLYFLKKIETQIPNLKGICLAISGLTYKAHISDIRNSLSLVLASCLLAEGADLVGFDVSAEARANFKKRLPKVKIVDSLEKALKGADALVILTEDESNVSLAEARLVKLMKGRSIYDSRNLYALDYFKIFDYYSIGRRDVINAK
jgi:UDPglucose 6-dehydrogenase